MPNSSYRIRTANLTDVKAIKALIDYYVTKAVLLPVAVPRIYERIRDYRVIVDREEAIVACGGLSIYYESIAEVRSLAVREDIRGQGLGRMMVEALVQDAKDLGLLWVFALTYQQPFFEQMGFSRVPKETLPHKIWKDCYQCPKLTDCHEVAMLHTFPGSPEHTTLRFSAGEAGLTPGG